MSRLFPPSLLLWRHQNADIYLTHRLCLPKAVLQLAWRPANDAEDEHELAIAGDDSSLRIYKVKDV